MSKLRLYIAIALGVLLAPQALCENYPIRGRVIDRLTRRGVAYAAVVIVGQGTKGASADAEGEFVIEGVAPGIYRLEASMLGYKTTVTPEYLVSAATPFIEIEMDEESQGVDAVTVRPTPFRRTVESPVSMNVIGLREIEKSPGSNRDIARIVRSYPGVSFSPVGYRNDLIVRGGGPSENRFFMDGIEIPNINHFATQGASGGPVSIVNADLIREINFYTGAFPADRAGGMSSVLDFKLRDGDPERQSFKATLGASEVGLSGSGHIGGRTTYIFSARQSYLQMLFKLLGLPFLPNYIDAQVKIKSRLSERGGKAERHRGRAIYALRRGTLVAQAGVGRAGTTLLRLLALQQRAAACLRAAGRACGQGLLFQAVDAGLLCRNTEHHGQQAAPARRADEYGHRGEPDGAGVGAALPHEIYPPVERLAGADAGHHGGVLTGRECGDSA